MFGKYKVITLCGSTKFKEQYLEAQKRLASVEEATLEAVDLLKSVGKEVTFEYNEGNHFGPLIERIEKAIKILFTKQLA